jgi:hypothetical protein
VSDHTTSIFRKVKVKRKKRSISDKEKRGICLSLACGLYGWQHQKGCPFYPAPTGAAIRASRASRKEK